MTAPYPNQDPAQNPSQNPAQHPGWNPGPPARPPLSGASVTVTWLLVVALAGAAALASFFGMFVAMVSDGCAGDTPCNDSVIGLGVMIAAGSPWAVLVVTALVCAFRLGARRSAWWVPLLGAVLLVPLWILGAYVATLGVPS